ncbi:hypothetical protein ACJRO7_018015 [Eucalyptus globulus]|uniref:Uncharacterized protein n=1 Tax=Eucalyptus globulus TaxID=34317 RepID=A0ABD3KYX3_EUCGL
MNGSSTTDDVPQSSSASSSAGSFSPPESSDQNNQAPAEDAERAQNIPHEVEREPVDIQDEDPLPQSDSHGHTTLYNVVDEFVLETEKLPVRDNIALDNMFRHWPTSVVQNIQAGHKHYVTIRDDTDRNHGGSDGDNNGVNGPLYFFGLNVYFAKCQRTGHYFLNMSDVFLARQPKVGDIILFKWDIQKGCFAMEHVSVGN